MAGRWQGRGDGGAEKTRIERWASAGAKEAAKKSKTAHWLHTRDRERTREATNNGAPTGLPGLSKAGAAWLRKHGRRERNGGHSRKRKGDAARVVGKARGEAVSEGPKEVANKSKVAHVLHMHDRERMQEATNDRVLAGTSCLSKTGAVGPRKRGRCGQNGGHSRVGKGDATRVVGKAHGETVSTGAKEAANKYKVAHLLHTQGRGRLREATNDGVPTGPPGLSKAGAAWLRKRGRRDRNGGHSRKRKGDAARVVGKACGEAVSEGPKEVANKSKVAHVLHMHDRERMQEATNDRALAGTSCLSKTGAVGPRKRGRCGRNGGHSRAGKGDATRVVGKAHGETVSTGAKEAANKNKVAHLLHTQGRGRLQEATNDGAPIGMSGSSKMGAARLRKQDSLEQNGGRSRGAQGASLERHVERRSARVRKK
jgi:diadenosine tetraphosphatase ApaH/serine/threonine PP2A family protein phosphatase